MSELLDKYSEEMTSSAAGITGIESLPLIKNKKAVRKYKDGKSDMDIKEKIKLSENLIDFYLIADRQVDA